MSIHTKMPKTLKTFYKQELNKARIAFNMKDYNLSWRHLERAHILGQRYPYEHTCVHWKMLYFGLKVKKFKEVLGQIPRLLLGGVKSFVGCVPIGNTGGANVPPLKVMEVPEDLSAIIKNNS